MKNEIRDWRSSLLAALAASAQMPEGVPRPLVFVKVGLGDESVVQSDAGERLGFVRDHVVDRRSGRILFVAVGEEPSDGSRARLVPYRSFSWDAVAGRLVLALTPEELGSMPEYDPPALPPARGSTGKGSGPAGARKPLARSFSPSNLAASQLLESEVRAGNEPLATVGELVLEPSRGTIAFILTDDHGGADPYVIPWRAMSWQTDEPDANAGHFHIDRLGAELADAPRLKGGDPSGLQDEETLARVCAFYKVPPPRAEG